MTITCTLSIAYQGCDIVRKCSWLGNTVREGLRLKDADVCGLNNSVNGGLWTKNRMPFYSK